LVQQFMKEDLDVYVKRSKLIERAEIVHDVVAITKGDPGEIYGSVLLAQTPDTLLTMTGSKASFAISERVDGTIGVCDRSLGDVKVQVIMEKMSVGVHLTNAATQMVDTTFDDVSNWLRELLQTYYEGGD